MSRGRVPEIRFSTFSNKWERIDLKSISKLITKGTTPKDKSNQGTINYIKVENIDSASGKITINHKITAIEHENYLKRSILEEGDILFSIAGTLGRTAVITKKMLPANTNQALAIIRLEKGNIDFVTTFLNGKAIKDFIRKNPTIGAQPNLSLKQVGNLKIEFPQIDEQRKIGNLFKKIDENIELNQHALHLLKQRKKAFLQKMFPRKGESEPKVRFSEFTEKWKPCSLGELSEGFEYGLNASAKKYDGENKYLRITDIDEETRRFLKSKITSPNFDLEEADNYLLKEGDLLFARTGASVGKTYLYNTNDGKVYYAGFLVRARLKSTVDPSFIFQNTFTQQYYNYVQITSQRSGQPGINAKEYSKFKLKIPSLLEQQKIGNFFKELDNSIILQEEKLESLKQMKKAFLQKMFV